MSNYRRADQVGGTYFFTVVTWNRRPLFAEEKARTLLRTAVETTRDRRPFTMDAVCLLPDHLHAIWTLPDGDRDFSTRWEHRADSGRSRAGSIASFHHKT
ncbi:MAG: transposase [Thermodesulfobacteriota bacterium]|jgi:putative transposase